MFQVQARMRHRRVYSTLVAWHACATWSTRAKRLIVRNMRRSDRHRMALTLQSWAEMVLRKRRFACVLLKMGARRDLLACRVALGDWIAWSRGHRSLTIKSEKLLRRLQNLELSRVMRRWCEYCHLVGLSSAHTTAIEQLHAVHETREQSIMESEQASASSHADSIAELTAQMTEAQVAHARSMADADDVREAMAAELSEAAT